MENATRNSRQEEPQILTTQFFRIQLAITSTSFFLDMLISLPLLCTIAKRKELSCQLKYILLVHLLISGGLLLFIMAMYSFIRVSCSAVSATVMCLLYLAFMEGSIVVQVCVIATIAVDRCVAIRWPLRYEAIFSSRVKKAIVISIWTFACLLSMTGFIVAVFVVDTGISIKDCNLHILTYKQIVPVGLKITATLFEIVLIPGSLLCIICCFVVICCDIRYSKTASLRTSHARVTILLQGLHVTLYFVPLLGNAYLYSCVKWKDTFQLINLALASLGLCMVPLIYGYRSQALQLRLWHRLPTFHYKIWPRI
uniref:Olfactory receptor 1M1-like n=1 Tax=Geotrypetes seraphini TaxID=260995 RepID=A0A6P8RCT3_GEOSA|nr:olfactory receptor 1M1-like [Geotrypetes seraphini]